MLAGVDETGADNRDTYVVCRSTDLVSGAVQSFLKSWISELNMCVL